MNIQELEAMYLSLMSIENLTEDMTMDDFKEWIDDSDNHYLYDKVEGGRRTILEDVLKELEKFNMFEHCVIVRNELNKI